MKFTLITAVSIAATATAIPLAAIAHADDTSYTFLSPSGNIGCEMRADAGVFTVCKIQEHTWVVPPNENCQKRVVPGAIGEP
jgi:hypothetical protein